MTAPAEQIKTIFCELPRRDRADLAHFLLQLDEDETDPGVSNRSSRNELDHQLHYRLQETLAGLPVNDPIENALAELRRLLP